MQSCINLRTFVLMNRIYVDLDDTICDYTGAYNRSKVMKPEIEYPQSVYGFYLNLKMFDRVNFHLGMLEHAGYDVWLLSRPSFKNPLCYTEKRLWVENNLGEEWVEKFILAPDKSLLIGDYLIDDKPWDDFQGKQFLIGSDEYPDWYTILDELT